MCVCSHFIMPILHISATGAPRKSLHLSGRSITLNYVPPLISSATAFTQSFYASASPPTKSLPPRRAYATSLYQIFFTFFYFKAPFFSKRRRLSSFSSLSSRVVFLFLFARNCDALPHTRTHEPSLPTRNLPADNLESGRISIMPPPPSFHNAPLSRHQEKF
jgi:hypothetical protein